MTAAPTFGRRLWLAAAATSALLLVCGAVIAAHLLDRQALPYITRVNDLYFLTEDLPIAIVEIVSIVVAAVLIKLLATTKWAESLSRSCANTLAVEKGRVLCLYAISAIIAFLAFLGGYIVFDQYPVSMDEYYANFDATFLGRGQLLGQVPSVWRAYASALEPIFMAHTAGAAYWVSEYLPVNAALRGAASDLGVQPLCGPLLAAVAIVAVYGVARRIWPEKPAIAISAAILLATSAQFLVTAMTPYSMTAHLAFNLVWLWLFLRGGRMGHAGALAAGFLTCGLHQLVFHPLFVAPFVLQLWLERRRRLATLYTASYAAFCLFWILYPLLADRSLGALPPAAGGLGPRTFVINVFLLLRAFDPANLWIMAVNLFRLVTWQNLLTAPMVLLAAAGAVRAKGVLRSLILGMALTLVAMFVLEPNQIEGWGYRYLHGLLGSACLLAAWQWRRLVDALKADRKMVANGVFVAAAGISLLVLFPIRGWQARQFAQPYSTAEQSIRSAPTSLVMVDDTGIWFGPDLVRNGPYLRDRPLTLLLNDVSPAQFRALCGRYGMSLFQKADAAKFGIRTYPAPEDPTTASLKATILTGRCGHIGGSAPLSPP